jgi:hypothetical protein
MISLEHRQNRHRAPRTAYEALLGDRLTEMLHSQIRASAANWFGAIRGTNCAAVNTPTYATDSTHGSGKSCVQTAQTGHRYMQASVSGLVASGQRPYTLSRVRVRALDGSGTFPTILAIGAAADSHWLYSANGGAGSNTTYWLNAASANGGTADTSVHTIECWGDGALLHCRIDGVDHTTSSSNSMPADATKLVIGSTITAPGTTEATVSHWLHLLCAGGYPGDTICTALRAAALAEFGA